MAPQTQVQGGDARVEQLIKLKPKQCFIQPHPQSRGTPKASKSFYNTEPVAHWYTSPAKLVWCTRSYWTPDCQDSVRGSPSLSYHFSVSTSSHQEATGRPALNGILSPVVPQGCRRCKAHAGGPKTLEPSGASPLRPQCRESIDRTGALET